MNEHEAFDVVELLGSEYTNHISLISAEATLDDAYFTKDINPPLYAKYPLGGRYTFDNREVDLLGAPPKYALPIISRYLSNLEYEVGMSMLKTTFPYRYNLGLIYKKDWVDMHSQIVNIRLGLMQKYMPL